MSAAAGNPEGLDMNKVEEAATGAAATAAMAAAEAARKLIEDMAAQSSLIDTAYTDFKNVQSGIAKRPAVQINDAALAALQNSGKLFQDAIDRHTDMQRTFGEALASRGGDLDIEKARQKFLSGKIANIEAYRKAVESRVDQYIAIAKKAAIDLAMAAIFG